MNAGQRYTSLLLTLVLLVSLILQVQVHANSLQSLNYYIIYDPVEDSGLIVVNATISTADYEFVTIPVKVIGEDTEFKLLNYTIEGDLLVDGVDYNEVGYVELLGCGNGAISLLLSAKNLFEEQGVLSYSTVIDTSQLEELGTRVKVVIKIIGYHSVVYEQVGSVEVHVEESEGVVEVMGYGMVFLTFYATLEENVLTTKPLTPLTSPSTVTPSTITPSPCTTPSTEVVRPLETPGFSGSLLNSLVAVVLIAVIVAIAIAILIRRRSGI